MNILMLTNTFTPHVGGVARSVESFRNAYREKGHNVLVIAPVFPEMPEDEKGVIRVPAVQNFNGSDFSVQLPLPANLFGNISDFNPDIVHSHHPFLLGDTALRIANQFNVPLVFTHHTMYERYTHYVPGDSPQLKQLAIDLTTGYANLCQRVFAPSNSVREILIKRGVETNIDIVPTGVDIEKFNKGDGRKFRDKYDINKNDFVIGHVGRLAKEKNLKFLASAVKSVIEENKNVHFLLAGAGSELSEIRKIFNTSGIKKRVHFTGVLEGSDLIDCFHAMDLFCFSSLTETQGMVITEAMAAGLPVVALDAPGVREVVRNGENGFLVYGQRSNKFSEAIRQVLNSSSEERQKLKANALKTAEEFSVSNTADFALEKYEKTIKESFFPKNIENTIWEETLRLIEAEWKLIYNKSKSIKKLLERLVLKNLSGIRFLRFYFNKIGKKINSTEIILKWLNLSRFGGSKDEPGLILIQIDGLSRDQLVKAINSGRMKFLRKLQNNERYNLYTLYSGVPSTTASVQAELFYGVKQAVPAFSFYDMKFDKLRWMIEPESALKVEKKISNKSKMKDLLSNGSSYSNIYTGGARESHFSPASFGWGYSFDNSRMFALFGIFIWHFFTIIRTLFLVVVELFLSLFDLISAEFKGLNVFKEIKFIPIRAIVGVFLRELITSGAMIDIARGVQVIHLNYLGYDEQSHRRGPSSKFAHWSLGGIDKCISRIWNSAINSKRRYYEVWIYSDHGQEDAEQYDVKYGKSIDEALFEEFKTDDSTERANSVKLSKNSTWYRASWLSKGIYQKILSLFNIEKSDGSLKYDYEIAADGPLGHVYFRSSLSDTEKDEVASRILNCNVPLVVYKKSDNSVVALTKQGRHILNEEKDSLFGNDHPFTKEVIDDFCTLTQHEDSGDFIISGWSCDDKYLTFSMESGAHGGPGSEETSAFLLTPDLLSRSDNSLFINISEFRSMVMSFLEREDKNYSGELKKSIDDTTLRVMTYNVHSCIGMDECLSPYRISRVIEHFHPDVVAIQELDVGQYRTDFKNQVIEISRHLNMEYMFHAPDLRGAEEYGVAVFSNHPIELIKSEALPEVNSRSGREIRGVQWVRFDFKGESIDLFNTHLGLSKAERKLHIDTLLSKKWLGSDKCSGKRIFCGDLNDVYGSSVLSKLSESLFDVQIAASGSSPKNTWNSKVPIRRIDHIFVDKSIKVKQVIVPRYWTSKVASDHLPLIVDLDIQ